jgi:hypothetical protein
MSVCSFATNIICRKCLTLMKPIWMPRTLKQTFSLWISITVICISSALLYYAWGIKMMRKIYHVQNVTDEWLNPHIHLSLSHTKFEYRNKTVAAFLSISCAIACICLIETKWVFHTEYRLWCSTSYYSDVGHGSNIITSNHLLNELNAFLDTPRFITWLRSCIYEYKSCSHFSLNIVKVLHHFLCLSV